MTTALAISVALAVGNLINPGIGLDVSSLQTAEVAEVQSVSLVDTLLNIIPKNPIQGLAEGNMLQIIVFALIIGIILLAMGGSPWVLGLGIGLFAMTTIFAFITLPVEFDASARALKWLDRSHLMNYFDHGKAKSALFWAAMTYVVGALSSLAMLLYYVFIFLNARGRE